MTVNDRVYLSPPHMNGSEMKYIQQAFQSNWVAPLGENVDKFEETVKSFVHMPEALAVNSGTAAMHLVLKISALDVETKFFVQTLLLQQVVIQ